MGAIRNLYEISCRFPVKLPRVIEKGHVVRFVTDMLFSIKGNTEQRASGDFARHLLANFPS
ncbi:MAG: hypothetical protein ACLS4X_05430, partial [Ruminococcus callidus]